ncbi:MAG: MBL fold metallo-hydrolase [Deltaproteobacteria bacterium]|nr:MBL fold metallo-hydrolase [Deltaproteobacteria bacterium]MBW1942105.1 MBL fold metallo-hydrolase [Deltaproteobacteria bacterium]
MEVQFWGTRGSLPASVTTEDIRVKIKAALEIAVEKGLGTDTSIDGFIETELPFWVRGTYGTNTPCLEIRDGDDVIIFDAGSGLRDFGNNFLKTHGFTAPRNFHIVLSHIHWDHIQGFPFFVPIYLEGTRITIYGCHPELQKAFSTQQSIPLFPVELKDLAANVGFRILSPGEWHEIAGFRVLAKEQNHPGRSFGYRIEKGGKTIIYSTDSEHRNESEEDLKPFVEFFRDADLLIFDAQYTLADSWTVKEDWGHSNNVIGIELSQEAGVKHLVLFHQDPTVRDEALDKLLKDSRKLPSLLHEGGSIEVSVARDGMVIEV